MTEEGEEEVEEEAEEDTLGYLTLPAPLWLFDLLGGVTPLLQVGLSAPGWKENTDPFFTVTGKIILCGGCFF